MLHFSNSKLKEFEERSDQFEVVDIVMHCYMQDSLKNRMLDNFHNQLTSTAVEEEENHYF